MAGVADIFGESKVIDHEGNIIDLSLHLEGKTVGIYFSAHWCPPCKGFTPVLADFYNNYSESKNFEIIFVSSDKDEASFQEYFNEMPWLALAFDEEKTNEAISTKFQLKGIPKFILLDGDSGEVYTTEGRGFVQNTDKEGDNFPWKK